MCLKYNLQETADCVSRQREAAMSPAHHTFLIDCDSGVCICLTGAPQPPRARASPPPSTRTTMPPPSRRLLRTCLTSCMKEQGPDTQDIAASPVKDKTARGHLPKTPQAVQKAGGKVLQNSLKRWIRRLTSCVRSERP